MREKNCRVLSRFVSGEKDTCPAAKGIARSRCARTESASAGPQAAAVERAWPRHRASEAGRATCAR